jgi:DUF4097 and DUF4098 domain-containing protein YvlB
VLYNFAGDFMKKMVLFYIFMMVLILASCFGKGISEIELVNVQEIELGQINTMKINYRSDNITLYSHDSDTLIIKEYMSENNSSYFAKINTFGSELVVEAGKRPREVFSIFRSSVEIFIPMSNKNISIKTSSGKIEASGEYTASSLHLECTSGSISVNSIIADNVRFSCSSGSITANSITVEQAIFTVSSGSINCKNIHGNTIAKTSSGSIIFNNIEGNASIESTSGRIKLDMVSGSINAEATSGSIHCAITENIGDISLETTSGGVTLGIPKNLAFNFSSNSSSGGLKTPFSDKLFSSLSDRRSVQGNIGFDNTSESQVYRNIDINTTSGSIRVNWIN